jgi:hypothetical protein
MNMVIVGVSELIICVDCGKVSLTPKTATEQEYVTWQKTIITQAEFAAYKYLEVLKKSCLSEAEKEVITKQLDVILVALKDVFKQMENVSDEKTET